MKIFGIRIAPPIAVLAAAEFLVFMSAAYLSPLVTRQLAPGGYGDLPSNPHQEALVFALTMSIAMATFGLYSIRLRSTMSGILVRQAIATLAGLMVMTVLAYLSPGLDAGPINFAAAGCVAMMATFALRYVFERLVGEQLFKRRVLVLGAGHTAGNLARLRRRSDQRGFSVVGYVPVEGESVAVPQDRLLPFPGNLAKVAGDRNVQEIVVAMDDRRRGFPIAQLLECRLDGVEITQLVSFLERETGKLDLNVLDPSWIIFAPGFRQDPIRLASKRFLDLILAAVALLALSPLMLLIGLFIWVGGGFTKPVLFRQTRVGLDGKPFTLFKFRTMKVKAEEDGPRWASKKDERVTKIGRFLRTTRLDELPQLVNVLQGQMSFVGPRPERPEFVSRLNEMVPYYRERHCVKPGITGWAQLCYPYGSSEADALEKLKYDLYYAKNQSLIFDMVILLQTIEVVVLGRGAR